MIVGVTRNINSVDIFNPGRHIVIVINAIQLISVVSTPNTP